MIPMKHTAGRARPTAVAHTRPNLSPASVKRVQCHSSIVCSYVKRSGESRGAEETEKAVSEAQGWLS